VTGLVWLDVAALAVALTAAARETRDA
jgi:hypothetical protein